MNPRSLRGRSSPPALQTSTLGKRTFFSTQNKTRQFARATFSFTPCAFPSTELTAARTCAWRTFSVGTATFHGRFGSRVRRAGTGVAPFPSSRRGGWDGQPIAHVPGRLRCPYLFLEGWDRGWDHGSPVPGWLDLASRRGTTVDPSVRGVRRARLTVPTRTAGDEGKRSRLFRFVTYKRHTELDDDDS